MKSKQAICKPQSGLTIIELLVVIAIAAVQMGYAAPSFNSIIDSVKVNLINYAPNSHRPVINALRDN